MTVSTVYACTQARAETLASLPPMVYLETAANTRRRHSGNPVWQLLHDCPNPHMDSMQFWELMQMRVVNRGNGLAEIVRNRRDEPVELWPIHPSRVEPFRDTDGSLAWRVYSDPSPYSPLYDARDENRYYYTVADRDMLNIVGFGGNGIIAPGVLPAATEEISHSLAMNQYSAGFFRSGARPAAVALHPGFEDDEEKRRIMREDLNRNHSGRENWNQIGILWEGMQYKEIQVSPEQSQLLGSKQYSAKTICQFYKVPPAMVQIFDDYKFSSVDAMIQQFVMTCLRADAVRVERAVRRKITHTMNGRGKLVAIFDDPFVFEFVLEALLRGDAKKQAETLEIERKWGVINANEWRALSNREPIPEIGDLYTVAGGTEDLSRLGRTYPRGANRSAGSDRTERDDTTDALHTTPPASGPAFDRQRLVTALERGIPRHRNRSPGASVADAATLRDEMDAAVDVVLAESVTRVESILEKELAKCGHDAARETTTWQKHAARLRSAIEPAMTLYCRHRDCDQAAATDTIINHVLHDRRLLGKHPTAAALDEILADGD